MSVKFASRANTAKQEEDPHVQFFRGELKTALDKGDLYMERIGSKRQRPVDVEDLDPEERSRFALVVFEDVIKALQVQRTCFYCAQKYSEGASLGRYQCAWHPGTYQQGAWSCCGDAFDHTARTRKAPNGCSYVTAIFTAFFFKLLRPSFSCCNLTARIGTAITTTGHTIVPRSTCAK